MMRAQTSNRRRATVLLMVVSILALLFVVVTGFLSVSRFQRLATQEAKRGDVMTRIVDSVNDLVRAKIAEQLRDPAGRVAAFEGSATPQITWEDTAGVRGASYIGAIDPVQTAAAQNTFDPNVIARQTIYPAVTSLDSVTRPVQPRLLDLMLDYHPQNAVFDANDFSQNARVAWMDADADGVADTSFAAAAPATELANAIAGVPVRAPRWSYDPNAATDPTKLSFKSSAIGDPSTLNVGALQWQRFAELSRYAAAVRVVPHGGMVALDSPGTYASNGSGSAWNRTFVTGMFNLIKSPSDSGARLDPNYGYIFAQLEAQQASVEAALRQRGGFLPSYAPIVQGTRQSDRSLAATPPILRFLEAGGNPVPAGYRPFPYTFDNARSPGYLGGGVLRDDGWQRFNLADGRSSALDATSWFVSARMNPLKYNGFQQPNWDKTESYNSRHVLTSASTSDELTRRLRPDREPNLGAGRAIGLRRGQQKFYLGWLQDAFDPNNGEFVGWPRDPNLPSSSTFYNNPGNRIARELINYYADMLSGHEFAPNLGGYPLPPYADSLRKQATMLAANTLAFAAPRQNNGFVGVVGVPEPNVPLRICYGYSPQPFISQVGAHVQNSGSAASLQDFSVVVELYNPCDPGAATGADTHALLLPQFALTLNGGDPNDPAQSVQLGVVETAGRIIAGPDNTDRFPGRRFMTLVLRNKGTTGGAGNRVFENDPNFTPNGVVTDLIWSPGTVSSGVYDIRVCLWRGRGNAVGAANGWHKVDEFPLQVVEPDPNDPNLPAEWTAAWRDCSSEPYFNDVLGLSSRWRMVLAPSMNEPNQTNPIYRDTRQRGGDPLNATIGQSAPAVFKATLGNAGPDADVAGTLPRFGPTTPMYTMNAGLGDPNKVNVDPSRYRADLLIHGANRPRSFPTVGFMLLVPRYAHVHEPNAQLPLIPDAPMGLIMYEQWRADPNAPLASLPADFGHVPVFDNRQPAYNPNPIPNQSVQSRYFTNAASGKVPWGQLVFDYFTTLDPNTPNLDAARVPGRINLNAAPWFVLSQLPVLGPLASYDGVRAAALPLSVRDPNGAGFFGSDRAGRRRFLGDDPNSPNRSLPKSSSAFGSGTSYTLGPWLAQAAAAYRDGLPYLRPDPNIPGSAYSRAYLRNKTDGTGLAKPYRSLAYSGTGDNRIRGSARTGSEPNQFGFVSLGELANVVGFESMDPNALKPTATPATDSGNPLGDGTDPRHGDYLKAISLVTLLDSHFLTTRSNTFTVYVTISDRENPQASVRSQMTVDRSNVLPKLVTKTSAGQFLTTPVTLEGDELPAIIAQRRAGYYNTRFDN